MLHWQAGAGGIDAMDWAERLERMYLRWCSQRGFKVTVQERSQGTHLTSAPTTHTCRRRYQC